MFSDLRHREFGKLAVLRSVGVREGRFTGGRERAEFWLCRCSCGSEVEVAGYKLLMGKRKYCDHLKHVSDWAPKTGAASDLHPLTYGSWLGVKKRCLNTGKGRKWRNYGGRGIQVCDRWLSSFYAFLEDMGERPSALHSIERRDTNGNYEPGNCYWATTVEQNRNKRTTRWVEWNGERRKLVEVCEEEGANLPRVAGRLKSGWPLEKALRKPAR